MQEIKKVVRKIGIDFGISSTKVCWYDSDGTEGVLQFDGYKSVPNIVLEGCGQEKDLFGYKAESVWQAPNLEEDFGIDLSSENSEQREKAQGLTRKFFKFLYESYCASEEKEEYVSNLEITEYQTFLVYSGHYSDSAVCYLEACAKAAGFQNVSLLSKLDAAYVSWLSDAKQPFYRNEKQNEKNLKAMFLDMGAHSIDAIVFEIDPNKCIIEQSIQPYMEDNDLGGNKLNGGLYSYFESVCQKNGKSMSLIYPSRRRAQSEIQRFKETIVSQELKLDRVIEEMPGMLMLNQIEPRALMNKEWFEETFKKYISGVSAFIEGAVRQAGCHISDLGLILLSGGNSQWYFIQELLSECKTVYQMDPCIGLARGAALYQEFSKVSVGLDYKGESRSFFYSTKIEGGVFKSLEIFHTRISTVQEWARRIILKKDQTSGRYGYVDIFDRWIIEPRFVRACPFTGRIAFVCEENLDDPYPSFRKWIIIDAAGKRLYPDYTFYAIYPFDRKEYSYYLFGSKNMGYRDMMDTWKWEMFLLENGLLQKIEDYFLPVLTLEKSEYGRSCIKDDYQCIMNREGQFLYIKNGSLYSSNNRNEIVSSGAINPDVPRFNAFLKYGFYRQDLNKYQVVNLKGNMVSLKLNTGYSFTYYYENDLLELKKVGFLDQLFDKENYYYPQDSDNLVFKKEKNPRGYGSSFNIYGLHGSDNKPVVLNNEFEKYGKTKENRNSRDYYYYSDGYYIEEHMESDKNPLEFRIMDLAGHYISEHGWKGIYPYLSLHYQEDYFGRLLYSDSYVMANTRLFCNGLLAVRDMDNDYKCIDQKGKVILNHLKDILISEQYMLTERMEKDNANIDFYQYNSDTGIYEIGNSYRLRAGWTKYSWNGSKVFLQDEKGIIYYIDMKKAQVLQRLSFDIIQLIKNPVLEYYVGYDSEKKVYLFDTELLLCRDIQWKYLRVLEEAAQKKKDVCICNGSRYIVDDDSVLEVIYQ